MKKVKMSLVVVTLMLATVGVFANKARFVVSGLVADDGASGYIQISTTSSLASTGLQTSTNGAAVTIKANGSDRSLFFYNGSTYVAVYAQNTSW